MCPGRSSTTDAIVTRCSTACCQSCHAADRARRSMRSLIAVEAAINLASKQTGQLPSKSMLQKAPFCAQSHRKTANFFYPLDVQQLKIGSASCRESVCTYVYISGAAVSLIKKKT